MKSSIALSVLFCAAWTSLAAPIGWPSPSLPRDAADLDAGAVQRSTLQISMSNTRVARAARRRPATGIPDMHEWLEQLSSIPAEDAPAPRSMGRRRARRNAGGSSSSAAEENPVEPEPASAMADIMDVTDENGGDGDGDDREDNADADADASPVIRFEEEPARRRNIAYLQCQYYDGVHHCYQMKHHRAEMLLVVAIAFLAGILMPEPWAWLLRCLSPRRNRYWADYRAITPLMDEEKMISMPQRGRSTSCRLPSQPSPGAACAMVNRAEGEKKARSRSPLRGGA